MSLPTTMRAATRREYGGPEVIAMETLPVPTPAAGELLIRVHAAGLDRASLHLLEGDPWLARLALGVRTPKRVILGQQVAGEVAAIGPEVAGYAVGDRVHGVIGVRAADAALDDPDRRHLVATSGAFAEYALAKPDALAHTPQGVRMHDAATLGVSGMTALGAVLDKGKAQSGERVLILGGSGAVGTSAIQLAVHAGAEVTAVCSASKLDLVTGLGAQAAYDYRTSDLSAMGGPFDLIVDIAGNRKLRALRSALTPTGRLVIIGGESGGHFLGGIQRNLWASLANGFTRQELGWMFSETTSQGCARLAELVAAGGLRPAIDRVASLDDLATALMDMRRGALRGQVVIEP